MIIELNGIYLEYVKTDVVIDFNNKVAICTYKVKGDGKEFKFFQYTDTFGNLYFIPMSEYMGAMG